MGDPQAIRIERGHPDDEELAAVVAVLGELLAQQPGRPAPARAAWCLSARSVLRAAASRPEPSRPRLAVGGSAGDAVVRPLADPHAPARPTPG